MKADFAPRPDEVYRIDDIDYRREEIENFDEGEWIEITTYNDLGQNRRVFIPGLKSE